MRDLELVRGALRAGRAEARASRRAVARGRAAAEVLGERSTVRELCRNVCVWPSILVAVRSNGQIVTRK